VWRKEETMKTGPVHRVTRKRPRLKHPPDVFDGTIQKSHVWLGDVIGELEWQHQPRKAYLALRSVLHALRDRLTIDEAVQLGAQLPMLIRGLYYEGWTLSGKPHKERHEQVFYDHVKKAFRADAAVNPEKVVRAVFKVIARHTSAGEIEDVKHILPKRLQQLWPGGMRH
jgi:uncharacterized protein (DUF2267 family)